MSEPTTQAGAALQQAFSTVQYGGAALAVGSAAPKYLGFTLDEWSVIGIIAGIVIGFLGFLFGQLTNWYFRSQHLKLERERIARL